MLIAECINDYFFNGELVVNIYDAGETGKSQRRITEFVFTADDLNKLLADLINLLRIVQTGNFIHFIEVNRMEKKYDATYKFGNTT